MNKPAWLQTMASLLLVMRVLLFEKYEQVMRYGWWLFIAVLALIFYWLDYRVAIGMVVLGVFMSALFQKAMQPLKSALLRCGDRVEYVTPDAELQEQFKQAVMIGPIAKEEVARRSLFKPEQIGEYEKFYLITAGKKSVAVPYEWIMGIEIGELPLP